MEVKEVLYHDQDKIGNEVSSLLSQVTDFVNIHDEIEMTMIETE